MMCTWREHHVKFGITPPRAKEPCKKLGERAETDRSRILGHNFVKILLLPKLVC